MEKIFTKTMLVFFSIIVFFLTIISIICTCREAGGGERIYYISDKPWLHLITFIIVVSLFVLGQRINISEKIKHGDMIAKICLIIYGISLIVIAMIIAITPIADQKKVLDVAYNMIEGNYSGFEKGGYLATYPNQIGITYFFYLILKFLPNGLNCLRIINGLAYIGSVVVMNRIGRYILSERKGNIVGIVYIAFVPLAFYIPFIYGNLLGLVFSLLAIYNLLLYIEQGKIKYGVFLGVYIAISVLMKQNYWIFAIGIILFLVLHAIFNKKMYSVGIAVLSLIMICGMSFIATSRMESMSGQKLNNNIPSTAWIAMGLQYGDIANGWYNTYNEKTYEENDYDKEKTNDAAKQNIQERINYFAHHPKQLVLFFLRKNVSQWNQSTFEAFFINSSSTREKWGVDVKKVNGVLSKLTEEQGIPAINEYCSLYQTFILLGVCAWIFFCRKEVKWFQMILGVIVIGGFVFHTIWEAKSQYTISYFVLFVPYAVLGYKTLATKVNELLDSISREGLGETVLKSSAFRFITVVVVGLLVCSCVEGKLANSTLCCDTKAYEEYINQFK